MTGAGRSAGNDAMADSPAIQNEYREITDGGSAYSPDLQDVTVADERRAAPAATDNEEFGTISHRMLRL